MTDKNISQKILKTIKEKGIAPKPKWRFIIRDVTLWILLVVFFIIAGISASIIIFLFQYSDIDIIVKFGPMMARFLLLSVPWLWIIFFAVLIVIINYNFKHTKTGYRHHTYIIVGMVALLSLVIGFTLHQAKIAERFNKALMKKMPYVEKMEDNRRELWSQPERGLIAGTVVSIDNKDHFWLQDFRGISWEVTGNKIVYRIRAEMTDGTEIKVIGKKVNSVQFNAVEIRPWIRLCPGKPLMRDKMKEMPGSFRIK